MNFKVSYTTAFEKEAKRLSKKYPSLIVDISKLVELLKQAPEQGTPLGRGLYKVRLAIESKGKGKSGDARVITYVLFSHDTVFLASIYDKSEQDTIRSTALLKLLKDEGLI